MPAQARDFQDLPALAQAGADGAAQIGDRPGRVRPHAARTPEVQRQGKPANFALGGGDLLSAHGLEIHALQPFLVGYREHGILDGRFVRRLRLTLGLWRESLGDAARRRRWPFELLVLPGLQQCHGGSLFGRGRVAPEQREGLVEHLLVLMPVNHGRAQGGARLDLGGKVDLRQGILRSDRLGWTDRQTGAAQQAREMHHVGGKRAGRGVH